MGVVGETIVGILRNRREACRAGGDFGDAGAGGGRACEVGAGEGMI